MSIVNTDGLRGVSNSHRYMLLGETALTGCPLCHRPFTDEEQARQVHARHEAQERARAELFERQLEEREVRARRAGAADAQEASKGRIEALSAEIASLKDGAETTINERTDAAIAKERLKMQADSAAKDAINAQEKDRLLKKLNEMQRVVDQHTANQLGDSAERDTHRDLTAAFPLDKITQVAKGTKGGDISHFVNHKGNQVGSLLHEIKNVKNWSDSYVIKARADKVAGNFDYAVVTTTKLPAGERDLAFLEHCVICSPALTVGVTRMLRIAIIKVSEARAEGKDGDKKAAELWDFFASGQGHELLMSASDDITKLRALDKTLLNHAKKHVDDSEKVYKTQAQKFDDIFAAIDRIIETD
jgi:hypothetical protein